MLDKLLLHTNLKSLPLNRLIDIITINSLAEIPDLETIRAIPRERKLMLIFGESVQNERETIGQDLKKELQGFQVGIHISEPKINIAKLIADKDIEDHQDFFEQCAKDYRTLGEELILKLVGKLKVKLNRDFPLGTFDEYKWDERQIGKLDDWRYDIHGIHCGFENSKTGQFIEVSLNVPNEFGGLDPYFFSQFIKTTVKYRPLPIDIFENFADGSRIIDKMLLLGKFEKISLNMDNCCAIVVTDR